MRGPGRPRPTSARDPLAAYARHRRLVRLGQILMGVAGVVALVHLLGHLGAFGAQPTGWQDLLVGYPAAGIALVAGAVLAGRNAPK